MKILVVCQYYYPEQFRINDISEQFVKDGHSVTVLTGLPNYPMGDIPKPYRKGKNRKEIINGVKVIRCFEIGRRKGVFGLAFNYASYMISASFKALFLKKDFDLIFVYQLSPVSMALPAVIFKMRSKKPLYLYCCDIWPESMKNILPNENSILFKVVKKFSTFIYSKCDKLSVSSKNFIEYFIKEHSIKADRISYIPQHAEGIFINIESKQTSDIINFVFMGNLGIAQDINCILDATYINKVLERGISDFNVQHHVALWKIFKIRPSNKDFNPFDTNTRYCHYDEVHKDYIFNDNWIDFIVQLFRKYNITLGWISEMKKKNEVLSIKDYE